MIDKLINLSEKYSLVALKDKQIEELEKKNEELERRIKLYHQKMYGVWPERQ